MIQQQIDRRRSDLSSVLDEYRQLCGIADESFETAGQPIPHETPSSSSLEWPSTERASATTLEAIKATYDRCSRIAEAGNAGLWRREFKANHAKMQQLHTWLDGNKGGMPSDDDARFAAIDNAISVIAPLWVQSVAAVEGNLPALYEHKRVFRDMLNIEGWPSGGSASIVHFPRTLCFAYQALLGAVFVDSKNISLVVDFVNQKIFDRYEREATPMHTCHDIMGWPDTLQGNCRNGWKYVYALSDRLGWIPSLFVSAEGFRYALTAYYMALNIHELAVKLAAGHKEKIASGDEMRLDSPLCFVTAGREVNQKAFDLLCGNAEGLSVLWESHRVSRADMEEQWSAWMRLSAQWVGSVYRGSFFDRDGFAHLGLWDVI